jgi:4-amino-4-deoxy-L-arabinose transferase-like glycosyltransferase
VFFFGLGWRDLWAPVEPRYAEIARVMFAKSEWIVPTVNGDLYTDKPILYFWLVLLAGKIFGAVNEWTLRLPAALGGVGFVLTTYFIGRDFFSARVGFIAAAILATSVRVIWEARWAHTDMLFSFFFALSVYFAMHWLFRRGNPYEIFLTYVFMALATLAKGLIGVVLPALILISFMAARRDWRMIAAVKLPLGIPLFLLITAPWVWLVQQATDGRWLNDFLYIHHFQRYTAGVGHRQPFYYYLTTLPVDLLPWTIFVVPALIAYRPYRRIWHAPVLQFFVLWFLSVLLFFSAADTKRELYLLPLLPVLALLIGNYFDDLAAGAIDETALFRWLASSNFTIIAIIGVALPAAAWIVRREAFWFFVPGSLALALGGAIAVHLFLQRRPLWAITSVALMMTLLLISSALWVLPYLEQFKSRRPLALAIKRIVPATAPLYIYADTMNDFNYYSERDVMPVLSSPAEIEKLLGGAPTSYMLIKDRDLKRVNIIAPQWIVLTRSTGSTTWNLVEFKAPPAG